MNQLLKILNQKEKKKGFNIIAFYRDKNIFGEKLTNVACFVHFLKHPKVPQDPALSK